MVDDAARKKILGRRARFVAAAMVGIGVASCEKQSEPQVCLKVAPTNTAPPEPCLSQPQQFPDAADQADASAPEDTGAADTSKPDTSKPDTAKPDTSKPTPHPCLKIAPHPCLEMAPDE